MKKLLKYIIPLLCLCLLCACGDSGADTSLPSPSAPEESPALDSGFIIVSEIMTGNDSFIPAADGEYYDWVELHNQGDTEVSLAGYFLSDDADDPTQFSLEAVNIPAGGYAIVYCSGVTGSDGEVHAPFRLSKSGESLVLSCPGRGSQTIIIPALEDDTSFALTQQNDFAVCSSPSPGAENSVENAPAEQPEPCGVIINEYMSRNSYTIYDCESDYGDWLELYNPTESDADLSGYSLSDSGSFGEWVIPEGTVLGAGEYLLIWCDNKDKTDEAGQLHASFAISETDTLLALYAPWGEEVSSLPILDLDKNISCGLIDGSGESGLFSVPSPGAENGAAFAEGALSTFGEDAYISEVLAASGSAIQWKTDYIELHNPTSQELSLGGYTLSQSPGEVFFTFPDMTLSPGGYTVVWCTSEEKAGALSAHIGISTAGEDFYLSDSEGNVVDFFRSGKLSAGISCGRAIGSAERVWFGYPTPGAENRQTHYAGYAPMPTLSLPGGIVEAGSTVSISAPEGCTIRYTLGGSEPGEYDAEYTEPIFIEQNTVLRAACFKDGYLKSQTASASYLVDAEHEMAIISVTGPLYATNDVLNVSESYLEYSVHAEYFDSEGSLRSSFDCGIKEFGDGSRLIPQKGFKLSLREIYGANEVTYNFFPDNVHGETTYHNFVLRPSGQDQVMTRMRDEMIPNIVRGRIDVDYMECEPCAVYINGEYWGLYYLREHLGADYLESRYGFDEGTYDLVKGQYTEQVGSNVEYLALQDFCRDNDMTLSENYEYFCSQVDVDNLIDFWVTQTFFANGDTGNIRCYKAVDGKWRWMLYDMDWSLFPDRWSENFIWGHLIDPAGHGSAHFNNEITKNLLLNEDFLDRFITRYCYHIQHTFAAERTVPIVEAMAAEIDSEVLRNEERWSYPLYREWKEIFVPFLLERLELKPDLAIKQLQETFKLSDEEIAAYLEATK